MQDFILVLNFGGQQARRTAQRLRSVGVFSKIFPWDTPVEIMRNTAPKGIIFAGGESRAESICIPNEYFFMGVPILAVGASAAWMAETLGGARKNVTIDHRAEHLTFSSSPLFDGLSESDRFFFRVWDLALPTGFQPIAKVSGGQMPAFADESRQYYGLQFYAEQNDPDGMTILRNFACGICHCAAWWDMEGFIAHEITQLQKQCGNRRVLLTISGGVDSSVCAALLHRAVGERLVCMLIDTGLLRAGDVMLVERTFRNMGIQPVFVDARNRILEQLNGISDIAEKRNRIEQELFNITQEQAQTIGNIDCIADGTIYPDWLGNLTLADTLKRDGHIRPLRYLFKPEVRQAGELLGVPQELLSRQPFPGPGLAIRIMGEVTRQKLDIISRADAVFRQEILAAGLDKRLWQYFAILNDAGDMTEEDKPNFMVILRAVTMSDMGMVNAYRLPYDLLERVSQRIMGEIPDVGHVVYDITGNSSSMIEWE